MHGLLRKTLTIAGKDLTLETGRLAKQAGGAVMVTYGDTVILVTATTSNEPRQGINFFPLTVDYEERLYAAGKIPGGFIKREGRPSEKAILSARLIDRSIRPLFPKNYYNDVHVVATVMSVDQDCLPSVVGIIGASAALKISDIPFAGPIGAVKVGLIDNEPIINPTLEEDEESKLGLVVAGNAEAVMMVEAAAKEISEETVLKCILRGHQEIIRVVEFINQFHKEAMAMGLAKETQTVVASQLGPEDEALIREIATPLLKEVIYGSSNGKWMKQEREQRMQACCEEIVAQIIANKEEQQAEDPTFLRLLNEMIEEIEKGIIRQMILDEEKRIDGRSQAEIRPISCETGILSRVHGSGLFTRGETQILTTVTLGPISDEQMLDDLGVDESKRYMHHYNFPPYSVGEARPIRGPGRREIGHGALAEKALEPIIPSVEEFPYAIRVVSEVLASNGSSSMGSVCGSTLALMEAGVPIKMPVAGVAMGLVKEKERVAILSDIQGIEDALGDMDFKVAGTKNGITALQMDIKIAGIDGTILKRAMEQAREGRLFILDKMLETIAEPRVELSPYAPRILTMNIDPDKIRDIIGPGGKIIKKIVEETGVKIDVEDDGRIFIASVDADAGQQALEIIKSLTQEVQTGKIYNGKVTRVTDFGAFVEVIPGVLGMAGKEGLVHISQLAHERVGKVEDVVNEGDYVAVKAIGFDPQGRLKLSRKEALFSEQKGSKRPAARRQRKQPGGSRGFSGRRPR